MANNSSKYSEQFEKLSNEDLLKHASENKPSPLIDAFFIGFLIGILVYGFATGGMGLIALIPLYLIYIFLKKPKRDKALQAELKKRGLW